jgi:PPOX class probable F420-dependent enzyme
MTSRTTTAELTEEQRAFLRDNAYVGVVTTLRADGSLHSTVVWIDEDGGDVLFNTVRGRAKQRHLDADPRVSVLVVDPSDPFKWVAVSGTALMTTEGADEHIDKLSRKYLGTDYPLKRDDEQRIIVRIRPMKIDSAGF